MYYSVMNGEQRAIKDAAAVCAALRRVLEDRDISTADLERLTGIPESNIRRMTSYQEPKPSQIARIERALGEELGLILRIANLIQVGDIVELLSTDPDLHPMLRRLSVADYRSRVALSAESTSDLLF